MNETVTMILLEFMTGMLVEEFAHELPIWQRVLVFLAAGAAVMVVTHV
jgi:F0F1-type ATP synthase assembly protein I